MKGLQEPNGRQPGLAPAYSTVSDFQYAEFQAQQVAAQDIIKIPLNRNLTRRKIYAWVWCDSTNTLDYWAKGQLTFYNQNSQVGQLPISSANGGANGGTPLKTSLPTVCTSGGASFSDCIGIYVGNPIGTQPTSIVLQPLYITGEVDEIRFSLVDLRNISTTAGLGVRVWLGVISSQ